MLTTRRLAPTKLLSEGAWCAAIALAGMVGGLIISPLAGARDASREPMAAPPGWTYATAEFPVNHAADAGSVRTASLAAVPRDR
jgi:hypothetical protein